jgi:hydroxymethylbilane synthase
VTEVIAGLNCAKAKAEVTAERAMLAHLDGSCHTPIAASATLDDDGMLHLDGMVLRPDGAVAHRACATAPQDDATALGHQLGARLLDAAGGRGFLA